MIMHITQGLDCPTPTNTPCITLAIKCLVSSAPSQKQKQNSHLWHTKFLPNSTILRFWSNGQNFAQLFIPQTKTSQHGIKAIVGCTSKSVCAWCAIVEYLNSRHIINTSFVHTPLFMLSNHSFIHYQNLVSHTHSLIYAIGLNPANFIGHSFRVGVATQAIINHMPEFHIQQLGHWKSNAYKTYIHTPVHQIVNYSFVLSNL